MWLWAGWWKLMCAGCDHPYVWEKGSMWEFSQSKYNTIYLSLPNRRKRRNLSRYISITHKRWNNKNNNIGGYHDRSRFGWSFFFFLLGSSLTLCVCVCVAQSIDVEDIIRSASLGYCICLRTHTPYKLIASYPLVAQNNWTIFYLSSISPSAARKKTDLFTRPYRCVWWGKLSQSSPTST